MGNSFTAEIDAFAKKSARIVELIFKASAQDVFEVAQSPKAQGGNMPVDTGFLRNSLLSSLNGQGGTKGPEGYVLAIAGAKLGDAVEGGWTANYSRHIEYGTSRMAGSFFALRAAQQWQAIVSKNAEKAKKL